MEAEAEKASCDLANKHLVFACGKRAVPEIIDTVFAKTSPKRYFSMTEYERFVLVFTKTRVYKSRHRRIHSI
jgi:hypothetical protein